MSREIKYIGKLGKQAISGLQSQSISYLIIIFFIASITVLIISIFGMCEFRIYSCGMLLNSFFWLDFIYYNFWFFILVYAIMIALSIILKKQDKLKIEISISNDVEKGILYKIRAVFLIIGFILIVLLILDFSTLLQFRFAFLIMVITPGNLALQVVKQMYSLIWMAFCTFGMAIVLVN